MVLCRWRCPDDNVHRCKVVIQTDIGIDSSARCPASTSIGGTGQLDIELIISVILPDGVQISIRTVYADARKVIGANPRAWDAFLRPPSKIAEGFANDDVVSDL